MSSSYLGLGTNLGCREENLRHALQALHAFAALEAISAVYRSEPVGIKEQPDFWNLVIRVRTELAPEALLAAVKGIEHDLGRRSDLRNAPRIIDIDILLYDDQVISRPELEIPHPRMLERAFVLRPLLELDPGLRYPGNGRELRQELESAPALERAEPIFPGTRLLEDHERW